MIKDKIKALCLQNKEGFSVDFKTLKPIKKGYIIALTDISYKNLNYSIKRVLDVSLGFKQIKEELVLGGWFDSENKRYCLDLGLCVENKEKALYLSRLFNQMSIFNLNNFKEIKNPYFKNCKGVKKHNEI